MKFNKILLSALAMGFFSLAVLVGCEDDSSTENELNPSYVGLMDLPEFYEVLAGETLTIEGKVYASQAVGSDRTIGIRVMLENDSNPNNNQMVTSVNLSDSDYTVPASVTIPAGAMEASFPITITNTDLGYTGKQLVISLVPAPGLDIAMSNDTNEGRIVSKRTVIKARRACDQNLLTISLVFDNYGSETSYELYDSSFNLVASGNSYPDGAAGTSDISFSCLPDGDYTFVIYDAYGDGMFDGTNQGSYTVSKRDANGSQVQIATGGSFADYEIVEFSLP